MTYTGGAFETATKTAHANWPIRPYGARVLLVPELEAEKTVGGIYVPDTARKRECKGEVLAVGPGTLKKDGGIRPLDIKPGDVVLFNQYAGKYAGTEVVLEDGRKALMVEEADLIGVYEP